MISSGIVLGYTHTHPLVIKREATKIPWLIGLFGSSTLGSLVIMN